MFAAFHSDHLNGYASILLALSPFEYEEIQSVQQHLDMENYVLQLFNKKIW